MLQHSLQNCSVYAQRSVCEGTAFIMLLGLDITASQPGQTDGAILGGTKYFDGRVFEANFKEAK